MDVLVPYMRRACAIAVLVSPFISLKDVDAQVAKWGTQTNKTKELNTNTNHYSKYTPNIFSKIKAGKGIV